jgi:hypothetical protein
MADNTDEEHLDNSTNTQAENPSDEIIPSTETETTNPNQEIENMEVHKHPHHVTHKKKWAEYILEFLMLFLAVFLGFIVENYREHSVEEERTEKHMHSMVENLKYDTTRYGLNLRRNVETAKGLDSFRYEIKQAIGGNINTNRLYYFYWKYRTNLSIPIINDAAISQLKSSGLLRMVKSDFLASEISDYYERRATTLIVLKENIVKRRDELNHTIELVFSFKDFDEVIERETTFSTTTDPFYEGYFEGILTRQPELKLLPTAAANFEQLYNDLAMYEMNLRIFNGFVRYDHQGADSLMSRIRHEYKF